MYQGVNATFVDGELTRVFRELISWEAADPISTQQ